MNKLLVTCKCGHEAMFHVDHESDFKHVLKSCGFVDEQHVRCTCKKFEPAPAPIAPLDHPNRCLASKSGNSNGDGKAAGGPKWPMIRSSKRDDIYTFLKIVEENAKLTARVAELEKELVHEGLCPACLRVTCLDSQGACWKCGKRWGGA